jgi:hypothetical protein
MGSTAGPRRGAAVCRGGAIRVTMAAMSVLAATPAVAKPDLAELMERTRAIAALAREQAQATEAARRVAA